MGKLIILFALVLLAFLVFGSAPEAPPCPVGQSTTIRLYSEHDLQEILTPAQELLGAEFRLMQVSESAAADVTMRIRDLAEVDPNAAGISWGLGRLRLGPVELDDDLEAGYVGHVVVHELLHESGHRHHDETGVLQPTVAYGQMQISESYRASLRTLGRCE